MRYLVIATPDEKKLIKDYQAYDEVIVTGVGYGNVFQALKDIPRDSEIVNVGYAGSNELPKGSRCIVGRSMSYHPNCEYEEKTYMLHEGGVDCYSSSDFVTENTIDVPAVFDMELYAIMSMGFENVWSMKVVSDQLDYDEYEGTRYGRQ